jgi:hypothetical protein
MLHLPEGLVAPSILRPSSTTLRPSHTMHTTGPEHCVAVMEEQQTATRHTAARQTARWIDTDS